MDTVATFLKSASSEFVQSKWQECLSLHLRNQNMLLVLNVSMSVCQICEHHSYSVKRRFPRCILQTFKNSYKLFKINETFKNVLQVFSSLHYFLAFLNV